MRWWFGEDEAWVKTGAFAPDGISSCAASHRLPKPQAELRGGRLSAVGLQNFAMMFTKTPCPS
jgi:hypothetical protein